MTGQLPKRSLINIFITGIDDMRQFHGKVTHLLSIVDHDDAKYVLTLGVPGPNRLMLHCDDVESVSEAKARERDAPGSRCLIPTKDMVQQALDFAKNLKKHDSILIHCGYGVSRSTAIAYAILCQAQPKLSEENTLNQLLKIRPQALPNRLIVKHADQLLNREGRMVSAVSRQRDYR